MLLVCTGVGLINGMLVAKVKINALVATLGTSTIVTGAVQWYTNGSTISEGIPKGLTTLSSRSVWVIPLPAFLLLVIALVTWYVLTYTPIGRRLYATGGSPDAAKLSGIRVDRLTIGAFTVAGLLCGIGGLLEAAQLGAGNPTVGPPLLLPAFAAAFLGATAIKVGVFNVWGTVLAVFTISVGVTGLQLVGVPFFVAPIFQGTALLVAVTIARYLLGKSL
jgi:ribose transport system permease protein